MFSQLFEQYAKTIESKDRDKIKLIIHNAIMNASKNIWEEVNFKKPNKVKKYFPEFKGK